jgi:hypothetical protein
MKIVFEEGVWQFEKIKSAHVNIFLQFEIYIFEVGSE